MAAEISFGGGGAGKGREGTEGRKRGRLGGWERGRRKGKRGNTR